MGILDKKGHPGPWIIAMDCQPSAYKVLDYGLRWGIECLFSDFKSRGFSITTTHLKHPDRMERLWYVLIVLHSLHAGASPNAEVYRLLNILSDSRF